MKILKFLFLFTFVFSYSQDTDVDSLRGKFTYLLKARPNTLHPDDIFYENFSLQISDKRSFYLSQALLDSDSIFSAEYKKASRQSTNGMITIDTGNMGLPTKYSRFVIIQNPDYIEFYDSVAGQKYVYHDEVIKNWKFEDEVKDFNGLSCRKAIVHHKGRDWIAWYAPEIPLPYGPAKFSGLPGLIVKVYDTKEDYVFELVGSVSNHNL